MSRHHLPHAPLRRRTVLGAPALLGPTGAALTGCDASEAPDPDGTVDPTAPAVDADTEAIERIGQRIADAGAVAAAVARRSSEIRATARALRTLHRHHLDTLGWDGTAADPGKVATKRARTLLTRTEDELQQVLVDGSLAASSGALAQVLASMSAAVAQRTVDL